MARKSERNCTAGEKKKCMYRIKSLRQMRMEQKQIKGETPKSLVEVRHTQTAWGCRIKKKNIDKRQGNITKIRI